MVFSIIKGSHSSSLQILSNIAYMFGVTSHPLLNFYWIVRDGRIKLYFILWFHLVDILFYSCRIFMFPWDMILKSFGSFYVCLKLSLDLQKGALISFLNIRKNTRLGWLLECKLSFGKNTLILKRRPIKESWNCWRKYCGLRWFCLHISIPSKNMSCDIWGRWRAGAVFWPERSQR